MATFSSSRDSANRYWTRLVVVESDPDPITNKSTLDWDFYIHGVGAWWFIGYAADAWVKLNGETVWSIDDVQNPPAGASNWAGSSYKLASGSIEIEHDPDGSLTLAVASYYKTTSTASPRPGSAMSKTGSMILETLRQVPGVPTDLAATWVSDTQVGLAWENDYSTNGVPNVINIESAVNGAAFAPRISVALSESASVSTATNRKTVFRVNAENDEGASEWSDTATVYTTPAAPSSVEATKNVDADIAIGWTPNVPFAEHEHVVLHGTVTGGVITWDGSPLAVVTAGTSTYTHVAPSPSSQHVYAVLARNTDVAARQSAQAQSNTVILLAAPNKPTLPAIGQYADKGKDLVFGWTHNSVDTTAQIAYEVEHSTNGGSSWTSSGKTTSTVPSRTFAADTYTSGQQLTMRVRTWGQATTGGSDGTGASPWSDQSTVTFKTRPVATILSPEDEGEYEQAALAVQLGFSQVEGATFVNATIGLYQDATLLEQRVSTTLGSTLMSASVVNGESYTLKVSLRDSNGIVSDLAIADFDVVYVAPVAAVVTATYLADSGIGQLGLVIPAAGEGEAEAELVTITRSINGEVEAALENYPVAPSLTILDTTPTIHGDNVYTVTTISSDGATAAVELTMTTAEEVWAFMSKGEGFTEIIRFGGELKPQIVPTVDGVLVKTSGRTRALGQYAKSGSLVVNGSGEIVAGLGSSAEEIEAFLLIPGKGCYRDPSGRRMFGRITGQISRDTYSLGSFPYTVTETS